MGSDLFFSKSSRRTVPEFLDYYIKTSAHDRPCSYYAKRVAKGWKSATLWTGLETVCLSVLTGKMQSERRSAYVSRAHFFWTAEFNQPHILTACCQEDHFQGCLWFCSVFSFSGFSRPLACIGGCHPPGAHLSHVFLFPELIFFISGRGS